MTEGVGLGKGGLMAGAAYGYNRFSPDNESLAGNAGHLGRTVTHQTTLYGQIGISARINLVASLPVTRWSQIAENADVHHRSETLVGFQDLQVGARYIIANSYFGPGARIFTGMHLTVPTAPSYDSNPFSEGADSTDHRHFALGTGALRVTFTGEWWHRSEFPWVIGLTGLFSPQWLISDRGFQPGHRVGVDLHAIGQSYRMWRGFPYLTLRFRWDGIDHWNGVTAANSGGYFIDGSAGLNLELTERVSGVVRFHVPLGQAVNGAQQTPAGVDVTLRFIRP